MTLDVDALVFCRFYDQLGFQLPVSFDPEINVHSASEIFLGSIYIVAIGFIQEIVEHSTLDISHSVEIVNSTELVHVADVQGSHEDAPDGWCVVICTRRAFKLSPVVEDGNIFLSFAHNVFTADDY